MYPVRSVRGLSVDPSSRVKGASQVNVIVFVTAVTDSVAVAEMFPDVAVMVVVPAAPAVARPLEPEALLIAAMPVVEEFQVTVVVRICVELSE